MISYFSKGEGLTKMEGEFVPALRDVIWVDLLTPTEEEKELVEKTFGIKLFTPQESEEIESSSKYVELGNSIGINLNFLRTDDGNYINDPVSFIINEKLLVTQRDRDYKSFSETCKKIGSLTHEDGGDVFLTLLETRIDYDADLIESITYQITLISKELFKGDKLNRELLLEITSFRESTIAIRENIFEKQRILFAILRSKYFLIKDSERIRVMIKDVGSLLHHSAFNFERLEFLQATFLGLVDMEQNRTIKIFTVVAVVFMPPTLIASLYGMNFKFMPELDTTWGYPFAIVMMVLSSVFTLWFFRWKKWL